MTRDYWQIFSYIAVGISTAAIDVAVMQLTLYFSGRIFLAATLSYVFAVTFNFICHSKITFSFVISIKVLYKYLSVVLFNYFLTIILVYFFVNLDLGALVGKIISLPIVALFGFVLSKKWVFR